MVSLARARTDGKWWLEGNFAPVAAEVEAFDLPVLEGAVPTDLTGLYVRNGSNPITG
ncbi:MAG: 9-cis-epoxycarotenoid dioxygenase, partial [Actinobacteria bacterium]|nr:9-cis-epoxycarotenoid dioxygenase [Actinomycetota bacterium]